MSRKATLPYDIRQECLWIVRGHDRRVKAYHEAVRQIADGSSNVPSDSGCSRMVESKAAQMEAIEHWPETRKIRAVEQAKLHIGADLENEELRQRLADGIVLNCENRNEYPLRCLGLDGIQQTDFYRRRDRFLKEIADYLQMNFDLVAIKMTVPCKDGGIPPSPGVAPYFTPSL